MVRRRARADSIYQAVQDGADLASLARKLSVRKWARKKGGDLGFMTQKAFGEIGKKAIDMKLGELSPPLPVRVEGITVGYSVFKVLARKPGRTMPLTEVNDRVATATLATKKSAALERFLANVKEVYPVRIDHSILSSVQTLDEIGSGRPIDIMKVTRIPL